MSCYEQFRDVELKMAGPCPEVGNGSRLTPSVEEKLPMKGGAIALFSGVEWERSGPGGTAFQPPANYNDVICRWL
jgi:hypothetical protein